LIKQFLTVFFCLVAVVLAITNSSVAYAQQVTIQLGKNKLPINEYFTISIKLRNQPLQNYGDFPDIEGFKKSSRSNTTSQIGIGAKTIIEQTITQNYAAYKEGKFTLKPFSIIVNGKNIAGAGTVITIEPMPEESGVLTPEVKPEVPTVKPLELPPFKSKSFLSIETDKNEIYVGEGVYVRLAFYLAEAEQDQLQFYNFSQQFPELLKQLKQKNAWEEAQNDEGEIKPDTIQIRQENYLKFTLYKRLFYPLNTNALVFNEVTLQMSQHSPTESFADVNQPNRIVSFTTRPKTVKVKSLPPHPLRDQVPVGQFVLQEGINQTSFKTGQTFAYRFNVIGEGNLGTLLPPATPVVTGLEIYPPEIKLNLNKTADKMTGTKSFRYNLLAKTPGQYNLRPVFSLVYFNPATQAYDTLQSALVVQVKGAANKLTGLNPEETDPFYRLIRTEENKLVDLNQFNAIKLYTNVVILFLICVSIILFLKSNT